MDLSDILVLVLIGLLAGSIAGLFVRRGLRGRGFLTKIVVGILGAFIGGFIFEQLDVQTGSGFWGQLFTATAGAIVLLVIVQLVRKA